MIKLIAADMDGTLLDSQKRLPPELPAIRYPDGIPEALFDRILGL